MSSTNYNLSKIQYSKSLNISNIHKPGIWGHHSHPSSFPTALLCSHEISQFSQDVGEEPVNKFTVHIKERETSGLLGFWTLLAIWYRWKNTTFRHRNCFHPQVKGYRIQFPQHFVLFRILEDKVQRNSNSKCNQPLLYYKHIYTHTHTFSFSVLWDGVKLSPFATLSLIGILYHPMMIDK